MPYQVINIPEQYRYVNQVPEFKQDVPDNCYIDKVICGSGFTTAILQNDVDYVIALPFKALGDNKVLQSSYDSSYKHELFMYHSGIEQVNNKLLQYLNRNKDTTKKILVTYDSISKLKDFINFKDYKLFIDEGHKLLEYAGNFKPKVINNLLSELNNFKSFVICTATPTREEYIPVELKDVRKIRLQWSTSVPVQFYHRRVNQNQLKDTLLGLCLSHYRNELTGNIYIFYNSVTGIVRLCKDLVSKYGLTSNDIKIICADTEDNFKKIKTIGKGFKPKAVIEEDEKDTYYKINFVTSTSFEGQDFLDPNGISYIVSDGKLEHTKLDISTQVSQIAGRLRVSRYKNIVNMLWTSSPTLEITSEEDYARYLTVKQEEANDYIRVYNENKDNTLVKKSLHTGVDTNPFFIDISEQKEDYELILNPNAYNHLMNSFIGTTLQYYINYEDKNDLVNTEEKVQFTLNEVFSGTAENTLVLPELSPADKRKLGKKTNFAATVKQYFMAKYQLDNQYNLTEQEKSILEDIIISFETNPGYGVVMEYIDCFGADNDLKDFSDGYLKESVVLKKIDQYKQNILLTNILQSKYIVGSILSNEQAKQELMTLYKVHNFNGVPKITDFSKAFEVSSTNVTREAKKLKAIKLIRTL